MFHSIRNRILGIPGQRYEYTEIQRARKLFLEKKPAGKRRETYPSGNPSNMQFDLSVRNSTHQMGWAYSQLITLGDKFNDPYVLQPLISLDESSVTVGTSSISKPDNSLDTKAEKSRTMNVSYRINLMMRRGVKIGDMIPTPSNFSGGRIEVEISAEGIYDAETGLLCMVSCRKLSSSLKTYDSNSMDCQILVNLQFPPLNSKNWGDIKGSM